MTFATCHARKRCSWIGAIRGTARSSKKHSDAGTMPRPQLFYTWRISRSARKSCSARKICKTGSISDSKANRPSQRKSVTSSRERAAEFLAKHTPVQIDGAQASGTLDRIHFIQRSLRTTGVVDAGEEIDLNTAMLGAIYVYPIESLPNEVTMDWKMFNDRITQIPCVATDEAGGMPETLDGRDPRLVWTNYLKSPSKPAYLQVATPAPPVTFPIPVLTLICFAAAGLVWKTKFAILDDTHSFDRHWAACRHAAGFAMGCPAALAGRGLARCGWRYCLQPSA